MARNLTEKQQKFLEALFAPGIDGNYVLAKKAAGYAETVPSSTIVKALKDEIIAATRDYLVANGPKAATSIVRVMEDPAQLGVQYKLGAAKDVLDRIGVVKVEQVEIVAPGLFIVPAKDKDSDG